MKIVASNKGPVRQRRDPVSPRGDVRFHRVCIRLYGGSGSSRILHLGSNLGGKMPKKVAEEVATNYLERVRIPEQALSSQSSFRVVSSSVS